MERQLLKCIEYLKKSLIFIALDKTEELMMTMQYFFKQKGERERERNESKSASVQK